MNYLSPSEYESYGLEAATLAAWVTAASAVVNAHCRRATLGITQYSERLRMALGRNTARLSYVPLAALDPAPSPIVLAKGRFATPRRGDWPYEDLSVDVSTAFGLSGSWNTIDPASIDFDAQTGELVLPLNPIGLWFNEVDIVYTAGLADIPDTVKVACAQIVRNAQSTPGLNVKTGQLDRMKLQYFADGLVDETTRSLLAAYVARKVG